MKYTNAELCLIWLDSFIGLEYRHKEKLYKSIGGKLEIKKILESQKDYIISEIGIKEYNTITKSATKEYLNSVLENLDKYGLIAVTIESEAYPELLKEIDIPPLVLYCKGDVQLLKEQSFAVVGSRRSIPLSKKLAEEYSKTISDIGFVLVTGYAEGIDEVVIRTAVENNKKVISVIAGGIDCLNNIQIGNLMKEVAKKGLIVGEYPPQTPAVAFHFPIRNRIIAGLSKATLVVSGAIKSGTSYTAEYAESYGRDLFAVPYSVDITSGAGCNELIKKGAHLTDNPQDISDFYGIKQVKKIVPINQEEKNILSLMQDGAVHIEEICSKLGKEVYEISSILTILEIKGLVIRSGTNMYSLSVNNLEV